MSRLSTRAGVVAIALLAIATTSTAVIVAVDSSGGPAVAGSSDDIRTVSVTGAGTVQGVPDTLTATFRVHDRASDVQAALNTAASHVDQVIAALRRQGVERKDMQTADLSLDTSYDNQGHPNGYQASESLTVRIQGLKGVGRVISAAATAAGNSVSIDGLSLDITKDSDLIDQARAKAFAEAKAAATQNASLAGEQLGDVVSIKETIEQSGGGPQPYYAADALRAATSKSIAIRPGQQPVTVHLAVVWSLD
jgi:uncharacterized protein YggE